LWVSLMFIKIEISRWSTVVFISVLLETLVVL
jgi:hypothetical protein